ncbi:hypothetical protein ACROYT_G034613 [Oculina patagonica]
MSKLQHFVKIWFIFSVSFAEAGYQPSIHWDPRNPLFKQNVEINVLQNSKLNIVCPNPATVLDNQDSSIPQEQMYENMWIVDKHEFDTCTVNTSVQSFSTNKKILSCNTPLQLKYYPLVFRAFSAPGGLEFASGTKYYFIATSNGVINSLSNYNGGRCVTSNMKMVIYVCNGTTDPKCIDAQKVSSSPAVSSAPETVIYCPTPSLGGGMPSSVLVQQSSPIQVSSADSISSSVLIQQSSAIQISSAVISVSPTNSALALISSAAVQCQQASIPEEFFSLFANQTHLLSAIYNYTAMIPHLELLVRETNPSLPPSQIQTSTNATQNCTNTQNASAVPEVPACPIGTEAPVLRDCDALLKAGYTRSGIYRVDPGDGENGFGVYCDQDISGGGWTIVLRRYDGSVDFDRGWAAYSEDGVGDITGEFWMPLDKMRRLTGASQFTIRFDLESPDGEKRYAEYAGCQLGKLNTKFTITVGTYSGDAGDSFSYHNGMKFSTKNNDNDNSSQACAKLALGGWWYNNCQEVCLTGQYENGTHSASGIVGIQWFAWKGDSYSLSRVEMKFKPA